MAAGLDINFEALLQDDARGLPPLLFAQAFPSPPDFSGWDAADAALAELTEVLLPSLTLSPEHFTAPGKYQMSQS